MNIFFQHNSFDVMKKFLWLLKETCPLAVIEIAQGTRQLSRRSYDTAQIETIVGFAMKFRLYMYSPTSFSMVNGRKLREKSSLRLLNISS